MPSNEDHNHHGDAQRPAWFGPSAIAAAQCLIGCIIGQTAGLIIGVSLGWWASATIALAVVLAYVSAYAMAVLPMMKHAGLGLIPAMRLIWFGEAISIAVIEIAMNLVVYWLGGIQVASIWTAPFWLGLAAAAPAGFFAAWPVNYLLLKHHLAVKILVIGED